jgi:dihydroorotase
LGFNKGLIKEGYDGDMVLVDLEAKNTISVENFASKGKNSPFDKMEFKGEVLTTIKNGLIVYDNGTWSINNGKVDLNNWWMSA